jgi:hypothetical protein
MIMTEETASHHENNKSRPFCARTFHAKMGWPKILFDIVIAMQNVY